MTPAAVLGSSVSLDISVEVSHYDSTSNRVRTSITESTLGEDSSDGKPVVFTVDCSSWLQNKGPFTIRLTGLPDGVQRHIEEINRNIVSSSYLEHTVAPADTPTAHSSLYQDQEGLITPKRKLKRRSKDWRSPHYDGLAYFLPPTPPRRTLPPKRYGLRTRGNRTACNTPRTPRKPLKRESEELLLVPETDSESQSD
ncbi:hypothetical protein VNI00_016224 [Paramarasmius palmivorus]|uniref:Uncharacterized protein n=1 Tax=Paramarasmius palmivorus TaxID=297713 RepID=A0AAW0BFE4_9AGAR